MSGNFLAAIGDPTVSLGSKEADDFVEQQGELQPHNAPAQKDSGGEEKDRPQKEGGIARATSQEGLTMVPITPPPNDTNNTELYSGDREVVFIGESYLKC